MTATTFREENYKVEHQSLKLNTVDHLMEAYAIFKIAEFKKQQFEPFRKQLVHHLSLIDGVDVFARGIKVFLQDQANQQYEDYINVVRAIQEMILHKPKVAKEFLGETFTFFRNLIVDSYSYTAGIYHSNIQEPETTLRKVS